MKKRLSAALLLLLMLLPAAEVRGEAAMEEKEAVDIASKCRLTASIEKSTVKRVLNDSIISYWDGGVKGTLTVTLPEGQTAQGIMICFYGRVPALTITAEDGASLADWSQPFENAYIPFSRPAAQFTIQRSRPGDDLCVNRLCVFTEGRLPSWVQQWEIMEGPAEMMLIATHPDDDILWFGGMLPTYAGEQKRKVMVVYMVGGNNRKRKNELLNALWHCGVRHYPEIGYLVDEGGRSRESTVSHWGGEEAAPTRIVKMLRKWKPQVVVTQDVNGEYGHWHHIVTVEAVIQSVKEFSADSAFDPESAAEYGVFTPQKLYVHLWPEDETVFDWRQPLSAFGGQTGFDIAQQAFKMHVSQQNGRHRLMDSGSLDCRRFGLYWSAVGPDEAHNDLFEHLE